MSDCWYFLFGGYSGRDGLFFGGWEVGFGGAGMAMMGCGRGGFCGSNAGFLAADW